MRFHYIAAHPDGKVTEGNAEAKGLTEVLTYLAEQGLRPISVKPIGSVIGSSSRGVFRETITLTDTIFLARYLALMLKIGTDLFKAIDILIADFDKRIMKDFLGEIRSSLEKGQPFYSVFARYPQYFSSVFVNMVKAGETSGTLDEILDRLATYLEKVSSLQKKITSALIYPFVVSLMAVGITLFLLIYIIPIFKNIFSGFGAELPTPTLVLIFISDFLKAYFLFIAIFFGICAFLLARYIKSNKGRMVFDSLLLRLPIFGILFRKVAISKFTRTLSTLIKSGVPILAALEIVGKTSGNRVVEAAVENVKNNVREGENIAEPLARSKIFPPMVVRMVAVGEQAGELEKMLSKIADFYDEQVDAAVGGLTSMIEPLIIAFLGLVIGSIVVCMFLPIFKIISVVGA